MRNKISIIFPVHNEVKSIERVLRDWIQELNSEKVIFELIICEDGSTDGTSDLLKSLSKKLKLTLDQKKTRRGYGGAVIAGIRKAKYDNILCVDSDGQCDEKDINKFIRKIGLADVLIGWRTNRKDVLSRRLYSKLFGYFFHILFNTPIHDPSAPFVLFPKYKIKHYYSYLSYLKEGFWWGFVGMCVKKNLSILEIPINHRKRFDGDTQVYKPSKMLSIAFRNIIGLLKLKVSK
jgi:hypothetical protein